MNSFNSIKSSLLITNKYTTLPYTVTGTYIKSTYDIYTILKYTSGLGTFTPTDANLKVGYLVVGGECW